MTYSRADIEDAIRTSWSRWTCDPVAHATWSSTCPARGQCAVTALVVQDMLGGELLMAEVTNHGGSRQGVHYWNRVPGGREVDLTREQFMAGERIGATTVVPRPADLTRGRLPGQYHLLSATVRRRLNGEEPLAPVPVSVKGVCLDSRGRVLLCLTERGDYELPGGRPEAGELFPATLEREIREETGLAVRVDRLLSAEPLEVMPGAWVDIVSYLCCLDGGQVAPRVSAEHEQVVLLDCASLAAVRCPEVYRRAVALALACDRSGPATGVAGPVA